MEKCVQTPPTEIVEKPSQLGGACLVLKKEINKGTNVCEFSRRIGPTVRKRGMGVVENEGRRQERSPHLKLYRHLKGGAVEGIDET